MVMRSRVSAFNSEPPLPTVDDVFSTYLYTGNGSTQTITNGIDLAGNGGLVWIKRRSGGSGNWSDHWFFDSVRGDGVGLRANLTNSSFNTDQSFGFSATGFATPAYIPFSELGTNYASWTFRKAAKFFDVVTYTGDSVAGRQIAHSLGVAPGMIIIKSTSSGELWNVYHSSLGNDALMYLNVDDTKFQPNSNWNNTTPTSSHFTVSGAGGVNYSGTTYVAYLFAHDTSATGLIQCGTYTTDGNGSATVNLGWEPQWLLRKRSDSVSDWVIVDNMRGWSLNNTYTIQVNSTNLEAGPGYANQITSTGFSVTADGSARGYIYMAIRRPNKPPTSGTQVYNAIARTGTGAAATVTGVGFAPDLVTSMSRNASGEKNFYSRLRGPNKRLASDSSGAELTNTSALMSYTINGVTLGANTEFHDRVTGNGINYIHHFFKRAPGFFDEVCWTGTGTSSVVNHNLTVPPELYIEKCRSTSEDWYVTLFSPNTFAHLNLTTKFNYLGIPLPTSTQFTTINGTSGRTNVSYLFATLAGISKVGSYTGNGSSQNIECGFAAGARFVLIKCTSEAGAWYVWDTARGIVSANDPRISINENGTSEVTTDDSVDPYSAGFAVNQVAATNINVASATYIFLAIA